MPLCRWYLLLPFPGFLCRELVLLAYSAGGICSVYIFDK